MKKTIGFLSAIALSGSAYADVNVSGYVDAGYGWSNDKAIANASTLSGKGFTAPAAPNNAFDVNEGGVWFTGNSGGSSVVADLDIDAGTFEQAYLSHKYDAGFNWSLGKWDGVLGTEANDSVNRKFLSTGILQGLTTRTHTGLLLGYDLSDMMALHFWVANTDHDNDTATASNIDYPALGFKLSTKMDGMNAFVGGEFASMNGETGYHIDVAANSNMGAFNVGAELVLTKAAVADGESGLAFGVEGGTEIAEGTSFDLGFAWSNGNQGGTDKKVSMLEFRAGPRFTLSDALTIKADYTLNTYSGDNAKADLKAGSVVQVAGIYKF